MSAASFTLTLCEHVEDGWRELTADDDDETPTYSTDYVDNVTLPIRATVLA